MKIGTVIAAGLCSLGLCLPGIGAAETNMYPQLLNKLKDKGVITEAEHQELLASAPPQETKKPSVKLSGYVQVRYTAIENDEQILEDSYLKDRYSDVNGFALRRGKIVISSEPIPYFGINVSADFTSANDYKSKSTSFDMKDAYLYYSYLSYAQLKAGQFKEPFSREQLTSDAVLLTPNRSLTVNFLTPDRDMGIQLEGKLADQMVQYAVGVFNGAGENTAETNDQAMWAGRLVLGTPKDFRLGDKPFLFSVGGNYLNNPHVANGYKRIDDTRIFSTSADAKTTTSFEGNEAAWGVDAELDFLGLNLQGEYLRADLSWRRSTFDKAATSSAPPAFRETSRDGWFVQAAYSIQQWLPDVPLQAVVKYEVYDADNHASDNHDKKWTTIGLNYYIKGHDVKLMADYIVKNEDGKDIKDNTFLTQAQIKF